MTKARENSDYTGLAADIVAGDTAARAGRKNLILNGSMQISQRGTTMSNSGANSSYHTLDRWQTHGSGGTYNLSQQTMTAGTSNQAGGCSKFARFSVITGDNNLSLRQYIEDVESIPAGYTVAVSFYAKGTAGKVIGTLIQSIFGTGGSTSMSHAGSISEHTLTTSWTRYTSTFTMPSDYLTGKTIGADSFNRLQFRQPDEDTSTTAWVLDVTGVQLEVGSVATDFEHRSYGEELQLCKRYFERLEYISGQMIVAHQHNGTSGILSVLHSEKRSTPSVTLPTAAVGSSNANAVSLLTAGGSFRSSGGAVTTDKSTKNNFRIIFTSWPSSGSAGDSTWCYFMSSTGTSHIDIDAEL